MYVKTLDIDDPYVVRRQEILSERPYVLQSEWHKTWKENYDKWPTKRKIDVHACRQIRSNRDID